jgi:hydrogenase maturation protease
LISPMHTRVLCLGNELVRDDGVGIRVGRILMGLPLPPEVRIELAPQLGFDLLEVVAGADQVVLVDAMSTGRAPGTCVTLKGTAIERYSAGAAASHTIGIAELMELAHRLAPARGPCALRFVGVEGVSFEDYGLELSPAVQAALPAAVEAVLRILGAGAELLVLGREASLRAMQERPALAPLLRGPATVK